MKMNTPTHPKFLRLKRRLGIELFEAVGILEGLWILTAIHTPDGGVGRWSDVDIEAWLGWPLDRSGQLIPALVEEGWIDPHPSQEIRLAIHDWKDHCPEFISKKIYRGTIDMKTGIKNRPTVSDSVRQRPTTSDSVPTCPDNGTKRPYSLAKPSQGKPIEANASCPEPSEAENSRPEKQPEKVILEFPTNGKPKTWGLQESKLNEWIESFPGIDVLWECRKALQWVRDNPTRRKTTHGMTKFLGSWLSRANDRGRPHTPPPTQTPRNTPETPSRPPYSVQQVKTALGLLREIDPEKAAFLEDGLGEPPEDSEVILRMWIDKLKSALADHGIEMSQAVQGGSDQQLPF